MKKILSIILCLSMFLAMFALPAMAEGETGYYLHIGDKVTFVEGKAGDPITFPMPLTNDENKHFVSWCYDEDCTDVVTEDPTISSGEPDHYYAWLKDYTTYFREEFNNVALGDTVKQYAHFKGSSTTYHGYYMPLYGNSGVSQGDSTFVNKFNGWAPYYLFLKDSDGAYVNAAPETTYRMTIKYRVPQYNSGSLTLFPVFGLHARFVGMANNSNMELHSKSGTAIKKIQSTTDGWVTEEVDFTTGFVTTSLISNVDGDDAYIPNIGFRLYANGSLTFEVDYIEIQKYNNVTFKFLFNSDETASLLNGDAIEYPALLGDNKWSLSKDEYVPVPETMGLEDITVYEYSENVDTDSCTVTYIKDDGTESRVSFAEGKDIIYPTLTPAEHNKADHVWSLSDEEYIAVPKTMGTEDIIVYEFANPAMSFENYNHSYSNAVTNDWLNNAMISDEMAYSGNYSMRYRNYNLRVLTSEPDNWATDYTDYYRYDEEADKFVQVADKTAPAFAEGEFYGYKASFQLDQGTFFSPIYLGATFGGPYTYNYKLSVKYYVPEGNETGVKISAYHINSNGIYFADAKLVSEVYTIPATATDGWKTLEMDISAKDHVVNANGVHTWGGQSIVLKVDTTSATDANAANVTVYFDDISYQDATAKVVRGDCDGDGEVNSGDLATLKLHLAGVGNVELGADCDKSGEVDTGDLALLKLYLAGVTELVKSYKILALGNSYSVNGTEFLGYIAKNAGEENFVIARAKMSGATIDNHYNNIKDDAPNYEFYQYNDDGDWSSDENIDGARISEFINAHDWDTIVIHGAPGESGIPERHKNLQYVIDYLKKMCPNAKIVWQMTWTYQSDFISDGFAYYDYDQEKMYNAIVSTVKSEVLTKEEIVDVIPTGTAVENFRKIHGDTITLDGYHLSDDFGQYLAALCWYRTLTGNSLDNIDWIPARYSYLSDELEEMKWSVEAAMKNPYEVTYRTTE